MKRIIWPTLALVGLWGVSYLVAAYVHDYRPVVVYDLGGFKAAAVKEQTDVNPMKKLWRETSARVCALPHKDPLVWRMCGGE